MKPRVRFVLAACVGWALYGCAASLPRPSVMQEGDSLHLADGTLDLIVIPTGGRVISVKDRRGGDLLWSSSMPAKPGAWNNLGGDKSWVWPQSAWGKTPGLPEWPPAAGMDQAPFTLTREGNSKGSSVRATGPAFDLAGGRVRIVRQIELPSPGCVRITSRLEAVSGKPAGDWAIWEITQIPWPDWVTIEGVPHSPMPPLSLGQSPWRAATLEGQTLALPTADGPSAKAGADGRQIAAHTAAQTAGQTLRLQIAHTSAGQREPGESLQVYRTSSPGKNRYVELELTSPKHPLTPGHPATLVVEWRVE